MSYYQVISKFNTSLELLKKSENAENEYKRYHNHIMDFAEAGGKVTVEMIRQLKPSKLPRIKQLKSIRKPVNNRLSLFLWKGGVQNACHYLPRSYPTNCVGLRGN